MEEEDAERLQQELLEATIREKQEELLVLDELMAEGFRPRQSLARTPPQGFSSAPPARDELPQPVSPAETVLPQQATSNKRLLSSPDDVQEAVRRRLARRKEVPPIGGILATTPAQLTAATTSAAVAISSSKSVPSAAAVFEESAADPLVSAPVEQLAGLATNSTRGIMEAVRSKTSKLNKDEIAAIGAHTERLGAVVTHLTLRLAAAEARAERAAMTQRTAPPVPGAAPTPKSFAHALRLGRNEAPVPIARPLGPSVVIYPAEDQRETLKTAEDTRKVLLTAVHPGQLGLQIAGVRKVGNAGVVVQTTSTAAADALKKAVPATLRTAEPTERQPLIALTGVDSTVTMEGLLQDIKEQNLQEHAEWTLERLAKELRLLYKRQRHNNRTRWVCQVTHDLRRTLINRGRIYVGWDVVEVTDHVGVTCCSRCQLYGHPEKYCRAKNMVCGNCGEDGHRNTECQATAPVCATCKKFGRKGAHTHRTASRDCPARAHAEQRSLSSTNYYGSS